MLFHVSPFGKQIRNPLQHMTEYKRNQTERYRFPSKENPQLVLWSFQGSLSVSPPTALCSQLCREGAQSSKNLTVPRVLKARVRPAVSSSVTVAAGVDLTASTSAPGRQGGSQVSSGALPAA